MNRGEVDEVKGPQEILRPTYFCYNSRKTYSPIVKY